MSKTCLVVDDYKGIRDAMKMSIEMLGFETHVAEDGAVALEMCKQNIPDVILLDRSMPNMDGLEFLQELRKLPGGKKPKVIFCPGDNDVTAINRAMSYGANGFLIKPFPRATLEEKLREVGLLDE